MNTIEDIDLLTPGTLREALELQADAKTRGVPLAGGTDLFVQWQAGARPIPERAIDLKRLAGLGGIEEQNGHIVIGASSTHAMIRRSPLVQQHLPSLSEACATVGGAQIQALGTIGGSVANASPAGDLAPSLLISEGVAVAASVRGEREIPLARLWTGYRKIDLQPDELLVRFVLPKRAPTAHEAFRKLGPRAAQAISKVMGSWRGIVQSGVVVEFSVALGSVAPTALRLSALEAWVKGKTLSESMLTEAEQRAADEVKPISDIRSTAEYRKWVSGRLVRGFLEELRRS
jgi:carbon-monoxide dehydrogenase medium subunit